MVQHRCLQLQTNAFVIPCYMNAWNCGAKCAELSCLSLVYVARGERKRERHECPLSRTGHTHCLKFVNLLVSRDGPCFSTNPRTTDWLRKMYFAKLTRRAEPEAGFQDVTRNTYLNRVFKLVGRAGGNAGRGSVKSLLTY